MASSIALIILLGLSGDYLFRRMKLPGLVGMLIVGVLIGPYLLNLIYPEMMTVSGDFRKISLYVQGTQGKPGTPQGGRAGQEQRL